MDDTERKELAERWKEICEKHKSDPKYVVREYNIWIQGYTYTGNSNTDTYLGSYWAKSLKEACKMALEGYFGDKDVAELYDEENDTFSGHTLYEADPPKTYEELVEEIKSLNDQIKTLNEENTELLRKNMIDFSDIPEFPGFTVYDKYTNDPVDPFTLDELKGKAMTGDMYLSEDGELVCDGVFGNQVFPFNEDKYIIQIGGAFYRW